MPYRVAAKPTVEDEKPTRELHVALVVTIAWVAAIGRVLADPAPSAAIIVVIAAPFLIWQSIKKV